MEPVEYVFDRGLSGITADAIDLLVGTAESIWKLSEDPTLRAAIKGAVDLAGRIGRSVRDVFRSLF